MQPYCCPTKKLSSSFYVCSVCMTIYCQECKEFLIECMKCSYEFDRDLPLKDSEIEALINLVDEKEAKKKAADERVDLN